jgi:VanZ family protein
MRLTVRSIFSEKPDPLVLRLRTAGWQKVWVWLPVLVAASVIAAESTGTFSAENTSGALRPIFERIFGHINDTLWWWMHHLFRKSGHFAGYGLVCLSFLRAWLLTLGCQVGLSTDQWRLRSSVLAVGSTAVIASLDEWHQTFLPSRTGLFSDVLLDSLGATVMCGLVWLVCWRRKRRRRHR